jgi:hypothetical protein
MLMRRANQNSEAVAAAALCLAFTASMASAIPQPIRATNADAEVIVVPVDALAVDALANSDIDGIDIPVAAKRLNGRRVRINGTMYPTFETTGLTEFAFIPETGRRPVHIMCSKLPLHSMIHVTTADGITEDYQDRPFTLEGILEIDVQHEDGKVFCIYRLRDSRIVN